MVKTIRMIISLLNIATILLASCTRQPAGETTDVEPTSSATTVPTQLPTLIPTPTEVVIQGTIRIWHSWDESELPALTQIVAGFSNLYPDVLFDVLYVPSQDLQARYEAETREGGGPTLLFAPAQWGPSLWQSGLVKDLTGLFSDPFLTTLNQPALGGARYQNALIGLPYSIQGIVLFRNKDIITLSPNTFEDLVTLAQTSTAGENVGAMLERSFFYSGAHLEGIGGQLMDSDGKPAFNNAKGLEWIELLREFEKAGPTNYFTDQDLDYFKLGRIGWVIDGTWSLDDLAEAIGQDKLAIDLWPTYLDGRLSGYVTAENLYLNPQVSGSELLATQKFIEYFLSPDAQNRLAEVGRIPAISSASFADPARGSLLAQAMAALAGGTTYPVVPEMTLYNINMDIALKSIFEEGVPPEQALKTAEEAILAGLGQGQATPTP